MEEEWIDGKEKLKALIQKRISKQFYEILQYTEVAVADEYTHDILRNRILTAGNDAIRDLQKECQHFDIRHTPRVSEYMRMEEENGGKGRQGTGNSS